MSLPSNSKAIAEYVLASFIKGSSLQKGSRPGFQHALKLSYNTIDKDRISVGPNSFNYRYHTSADVPKFNLGLLTALMDELSTVACYRVGLPSPPGLSLQMQTELVPNTQADLSTMKEMDIENYVTKLGKTISHTRTDFRCAETKELVAFSSHVKYMPTGNRVMDLVFTSPFWIHWYNWWALKSAKLPLYEEKPLFDSVLKSHLEHHESGSAIFHVTPEHTNPFGGLHGGCHAMVMEAVAEPYAKELLKTSAPITLEAMQIEYLSAGKGNLEVVCEPIGNPSGPSVYVRVLLKKGDRVSSEGKLKFSTLRSRL